MTFMHYRDLDVFKRAYGLALEIHKASANFPKTEQFGGMADQMRRSSKSICANMAEGLGKGESKKEQMRFLRISMGSSEEMLLWLQFCVDLGYVPAAQAMAWQNDYSQVGKILNSLIEKRKR
jgi:four helix bundle protein